MCVGVCTCACTSEYVGVFVTVCVCVFVNVCECVYVCALSGIVNVAYSHKEL